jgi:probable phosphoglycerate mutase
MAIKYIYLVRHGESEGNAGPRRQGPLSSLTQKGREQAKIIAERCKTLPIDTCISSTMTRAKETADIISKEIGKEFQHSDLLIERLRPSRQFGMAKDDPESMKIDKLLTENFSKPGYRIEDEENFEDLNLRAEKALHMLEVQNGEHILVVTHGLFMRILVGRVIFGNDINGKLGDHLFRAMKTNNTGLTVFKFDSEKNEWVLITWNDHAHLG